MGLYRRKDGKNYWFTINHNGVRIQKSTGTDNKRLAERIYAKVLTDAHEGKWVQSEAKRRTFEEMRDRYMTDYAIPNKAPKTVQKDHNTFKQLSRFFGGLKLSAITPQRIAEYKRLRHSQGRKTGTLAKELELLRASLNIALKEWEWIETTPFWKVKIEQPKKGMDRWLRPEEEHALLAECPEWLRAIVVFALNTGMRRNEVLSLKWKHVNLEESTAMVDEPKNGEVRTIPLNIKAHEVLESKGNMRPISGYVFHSKTGTKISGNNLRRAFNEAVKRSGIEHVRFHDLRHTFATRLVQMGTDIYRVKELLGHKSLKMTTRYAHHDTSSLRSAVEILDRIEA